MSIAAARLTPREHAAVTRFLRRALARGNPPLFRAALFGSKARGDFDRDSDVDVLLVADVDADDRLPAAEAFGRLAGRVTEETGVEIEPWTVCVVDLDEGRRTPMLVDAAADSIPLWPAGAPPLRAPFTPADAVFCAECLLGWVEAGGDVSGRALAEGALDQAARRARDDIARLATAALVLCGDTRHRRVGTLRRFEERFVRTGTVSPRVLPALAWAARAYPPDGGRGQETPPVPAAAAATAALGRRLVATLEAELVPRLLARIAELDSPAT